MGCGGSVASKGDFKFSDVSRDGKRSIRGNSNRPSPFATVPTEVIVLIMRHLNAVQISTLSKCCSRLNLISYDVSLRTKWELLSTASSRVMDSTLNRAARLAGGMMTALDFSGCQRFSPSGLCLLLEANPDLEEIVLTGCAAVTPDLIQYLAAHNPKLTKAHLALPTSNSYDMGPVLKSLAEGCSGLRDLDITGWRVENLSLETVGDFCQSLTRLSFSCFYNSMDKVVDDAGITAFCELATSVKYLSVAHAQFFTSQSYNAIFSLRSLEQLTLQHCDIAEVSLPSKGCPTLRQLTLSHVRVRDPEIATILHACPHLTHLRTRFCTYLSDAFLESMLEFCSKLRVVDFFGCPVSDNGVKTLTAAIPRMSFGMINLSHTNITDHSVEDLLDLGACVPVVDVADCPKVRPMTIVKFYQRRQTQRQAIQNQATRQPQTNSGMRPSRSGLISTRNSATDVKRLVPVSARNTPRNRGASNPDAC